MKLRLIALNFVASTAQYEVTTNADKFLFSGESEYPPSAQTLPAIRQAILPNVRALGVSLRTDAQAHASLLAGIETDPLP